jgi:hypothetical protein
MLINWHHEIIQDTLQKVIEGKIKRLIINIPPRFSKTEMATINFIARGLAINPSARFMHLSYSDNLALENSSTAKNIIESDEYQAMWGLKLRDDAKSKKKWWTEQNGGVYAASAGGQVTGFGAGLMKEGFTGALLIDDPVKPDDADYDERKNVNKRFQETVESRIAHEDIPIIIIMQRIHTLDLSGFLLKGGNGEMWNHLNLPVYSDGYKYPKENTHGIEIPIPKSYGNLWDYKYNDTHKIKLMSNKRRYWCQYMQQPEKYKVEGALWTQALLDTYRDIDSNVALERIVVGVDPSGDDGKEDNGADAIGIIVCGYVGGHYYVLADGTMNGSPKEWASKAVSLYNTWDADIIAGEKNYGGAMVEHTIRSVDGGELCRYKNVNASRGKLLRAEPIVALYEQGLVHHVGTFHEMENELCSYNGKGKSPNRLDALVWALTELSKGISTEISAPEVSLFT